MENQTIVSSKSLQLQFAFPVTRSQCAAKFVVSYYPFLKAALYPFVSVEVNANLKPQWIKVIVMFTHSKFCKVD